MKSVQLSDKELRQYLKAKVKEDYSLREFSAHTGLNKNLLSEYFRGIRDIKISTLFRIVEGVNCSLSLSPTTLSKK